MSGLVTNEGGATTTFTVALNSVPSAPVTIPVTSSDPTEGAVGTAALTFAPSITALTPQTITITGQNDLDFDGDVAYTVVLGAATGEDSAFSGQNPPDIAVMNQDDDVVRCSPRPPVAIATARTNDGRLRVSVTTSTILPGPQNRIVEIQFDGGTNAVVHLPGQAPRAGPFTYDIPNQPMSFVFHVGRQGAGATHLPFKVIDGCSSNPWPTFVGGGPAAF
jgi:hypothetical protein